MYLSTKGKIKRTYLIKVHKSPLSLTSVVSKFCEKIRRKWLYQFLERNWIIPARQLNELLSQTDGYCTVQEREGWVDCVYQDLKGEKNMGYLVTTYFRNWKVMESCMGRQMTRSRYPNERMGQVKCPRVNISPAHVCDLFKWYVRWTG